MVHDDPIAALERELVSAARRLGAGEETISLPGARRAGVAGTRTRPVVVHGSRGAVAVLLSTASVIAIVLGAVVALGGHRQPSVPTPAPAPAASATGARQLTDILGVLRRPQTAADRPVALVSRFALGVLALAGTPDLALMRYATTTPWGEQLYVVPMTPPTAQQIESFARRIPGARNQLLRMARRRPETLMVLSADGAGGAGDAATIEQGQGIGTEGAGRSFAGGSTATRITVVVPDGVATVRFVFSRQPFPGQPGAPVYSHSLSVLAPVHGNVVAVQVDREVTEASLPMIWYRPDGQVVKRIGDLTSVNRVIPPPKVMDRGRYGALKHPASPFGTATFTVKR